MTIKDIKKSLVVFLAIFGFFSGAKVSATTYSYDVDVKFNFNSKLSVTITDADIKILDLAPGTSADSNIVGITIGTNNVAGYTAEATVGNVNNATTNMTHTNGTNTFASIATNASQATLTTDNTWGYAVSTDNGTSWSNFSGLPIYTSDGKELASTNSPAQDSIKFKINAKASTSQPAGDYKNVINFTVVVNTPPRDWPDVDPCPSDATKCDEETGRLAIQNVNEGLCDSVEAYDTQYQVTDLRDHKTYWISKLRDGHCWMTQNLDFNIPTTALTSETTDLTYFGDNGYDATHGYSKDASTNVISWTPTRATINAVTDSETAGSISGWTNDYNAPYSVDTGDWYWKSTPFYNSNLCYVDSNDQTCNYVTKADNTYQSYFSTTPYSDNGTHGHVGNYYNWSAAVASNDTSSYTVSTYDDITNNPQNSICPAGWRLPTIYNSATDSKNEYRYLLDQYGAYVTSGSERDKALTDSPLYFVRGGRVGSGSLGDSGYYGHYWSSTVTSGSNAYNLYFGSSNVTPTTNLNRHLGRSLRCIAR